MSDTQSPLQRFISDLKRRKVFRVALVYIIGAWILLQVAEVTFEPLDLPEWAMPFMIVLVIVGFALAVALAWALEVTPEGIKRTKPINLPASADEPAGSDYQLMEYLCTAVSFSS